MIFRMAIFMSNVLVMSAGVPSVADVTNLCYLCVCAWYGTCRSVYIIFICMSARLMTKNRPINLFRSTKSLTALTA